MFDLEKVELWWLIGFAVFFVLGWLAARVDIRQVVHESRALPRSYFKGLNFLLNEQPDKAIEAFIEVVKVDPETVELHFALGSLFRRRGETERAIRMHRTCWNVRIWAGSSGCTPWSSWGRTISRPGFSIVRKRCFSSSRARRIAPRR